MGQNEVKAQLKSALLMDRHIILVGQPGIGKTTLAKNVSKLLPEITVNDCSFHCDPSEPVCPSCTEAKEKKKKIPMKKLSGEELFIRVQGSPDLTAEDLLGDIDPIKALKFGPMSTQAFSPGKIFKANQGILFFDEVNRCSEKLQNALLQVLEERRITLGTYSFDFKADFVFIGTMNPDDASTEPLSDVFLDRFDFIYMSYPENVDIEVEIVKEKGKKLIEFPDRLLLSVINFIRELRADRGIDKKPGVRASLGLYERSQSNAQVHGRNIVTVKDVKDVLISVLGHRISLKPSIKYLQTPNNFLLEKFANVEEEMGGSL